MADVNLCLGEGPCFLGASALGLPDLQRTLLQAIEKCDGFGVQHAILLLTRHLDLRAPLPPTARATLARALYGLVTLPRVEPALLALAATAAARLLKTDDRLPLVLDWVPLYAVFEDLYFRKQRAAVPVRADLAPALVRMTLRAVRYFPPEATSTILQTFRQYWCPLHQQVFKGEGFVSLLLPTALSPDDEDGGAPWLEEWLAIWHWVDSCPLWDHCHVALVARVARDRVGWINWNPHCDLIFTHILRMLALPTGAAPSSAEAHHVPGAGSAAVFGAIGGCVLDSAAELVVWMMGSKSRAQAHLTRLLKAAAAFFHPAAAGPWCAPLGTLLLSLAEHMTRRRVAEARAGSPVPASWRLTEAQLHEFVSSLLPAAFTAMFANHPEMTTNTNKALQRLLRLAPEVVLDPFLRRAHPALESPLQVHQTLAVMNLLGHVVPALLEAARHATLLDLLWLTLPGLDANDLVKTTNALQFFCAALLFADFELREGRRAPEFWEWAHAFLRQLLAVLPDLCGSAASAEPAAHDHLLRWAMTAYWAALPPDPLAESLRILRRWLLTNLHLSALGLVGDICASACAAHPSLALEQLVPPLVDAVVDRHGRPAELSHSEARWHLHLLAGCCPAAGVGLLAHRPRIDALLQAVGGAGDAGRGAAWGKVAKKVLRALTSVYPTDFAPHPPGLPPAAQTLGYPYAEAECRWHVPSLEEVTWAVELFNEYVGRALTVVAAAAARLEEDQDVDPLPLRLALQQLKALLSGARGLLPPLRDLEGPSLSPLPTAPPSAYELHEQAAPPLLYRRAAILEALEPLLKCQDGPVLGTVAKLVYGLVVVQSSYDRYKYLAWSEYLKAMKPISTVTRPADAERRFARCYLVHAAALQYCRQQIWADALRPVTNSHRRAIAMLTELCFVEDKKVVPHVLFTFSALLEALPLPEAQRAVAGVLQRLQPPEGADATPNAAFDGGLAFLSLPLVMRHVTESWPLLAIVLPLLPTLQAADPGPDRDRCLEAVGLLLRGELHCLSLVPIPKGNLLAMQLWAALRDYDALLLRLAEVGARPLHWRRALLVLQFVATLLQPACRTCGGVRVPAGLIRFILGSCTHEHPDVRRISLPLVVALTTLYKPPLPHQPLAGLGVVPHRSWQGYYAPWHPPITTSSSADFICAPSVDAKDEFSQLLTQYFASPAGSAFLARVFADARGAKEAFNVELAQFFKGLYQVMGLEVMNLIQPELEHHLEGLAKGDPTYLCLGAFPECLAGLVRVLKYHPEEQQQLAWDFVEATLLQLTPASKMEGPFLQGCLNFCTYNLHPAITHRLRAFWTDRLDLLRDRVASLPLLALSFLDLSGLWRCPNELNPILVLVRGHFGHSYAQLRSCSAMVISDAFTRASRPLRPASLSRAPEPLPGLVAVHRDLVEYYRSVKKDATPEVIGNVNTSFAQWYSRQAELSAFVEPFMLLYLDHLVEMLNEATDVASLAALHYALLNVGKGFVSRDTVQRLWHWLHQHLVEPPTNWRTLHALLALLQVVLSGKQFYLDPDSIRATAEVVAELLKHSTVEVRENARHCVSLVAQMSDAAVTDRLVARFAAWCRAPKTKGAAAAEGGKLRAAGCLGLGGLLLAYPFTVPSFAPDVLCLLARHANTGGDAGATVRRTFADWWRSHSDEWDFGFKELFTEDQQQIITSLIYSPIYYA